MGDPPHSATTMAIRAAPEPVTFLRLAARRWLAVEFAAGLLALYLADLAMVGEIHILTRGAGWDLILAFATGGASTACLASSLRLPGELWRESRP